MVGRRSLVLAGREPASMICTAVTNYVSTRPCDGRRASYWLATHPFFNRFTWSYIRRRNVTRASGEGSPLKIPRTPRQTFVGLSMFRTCYTHVE